MLNIKFYDENLKKKIYFGSYLVNLRNKEKEPYLNHSYRVYRLYEKDTGGSAYVKVFALSYIEESYLDPKTGEDKIRADFKYMFSNKVSDIFIHDYDKVFTEARWVFTELEKINKTLGEPYKYLPVVGLNFIGDRKESGFKLSIESIQPVLYKTIDSTGTEISMHQWFFVDEIFKEMDDPKIFIYKSPSANTNLSSI